MGLDEFLPTARCDRAKGTHRAIKNLSTSAEGVCGGKKVSKDLQGAVLPVRLHERINPEKLWQQISAPEDLLHTTAELVKRWDEILTLLLMILQR